MFTARPHENTFLLVLRWTARMLSALSIAGLLLLVFSGEPRTYGSSWEEWGLLLLVPLGLITGLILGWQEEAKGGALSVSSAALFYLAYGLLLRGSFSEASWILLFLIPGALLLLHSALLSRRRSKAAAS